MDIERLLLSKCVHGGQIESVVSRGIGERHFEDETNRAVFRTLTNHMSRYAAPPSREAVLFQHPGYQLEIVTDTIEYVIDQFIKHAQQRVAEMSVLDLAARIKDPREVVPIDMLFMEHAERVAQAVPSSKVAKLSEVPSRIQLYNEMRAKGRIPGVPFGIPTIDQIVLGVQPHELVVVTAPSSWGKSTLLQYIALASYLDNPIHKPAFISLEMDAEAILRKFDTMATNFEYHALRALELGVGDLQKWEQWGERVQKAPNDIIIIDIHDGECTTDRVWAEMLRFKPTAMFVDYFGIMTPAKNGREQQQWQSMSSMAKSLKRIPRALKIPVFTAAQTGRSGFKEGVRADNIADTIEIFRSADIMLGLEWDEEQTPEKMIVKLVKNRDGKKGHAELAWKLANMLIYERSAFGQRADKDPVPAAVMPMIHNNPFFLQSIGA